MDESNRAGSIADVVKAIDGDGIYTDCVMGLKMCSEKKPCPVHFEYKEIKRNLITMLETNTIADFNEKLDSSKYFLKND
jgi:DNA-binding IscR family transcriptional regulator